MVEAIIRSSRVLTPDGIRPASLYIAAGRITRIGGHDDGDDASGAGEIMDAGDLLVMPGVVDTHVHVNEPGRTAWEGFATATAAAAAGGVTTILDMPLNSVPATTTAAALQAKRDALAAAGATGINVEFIGGVVPGNAHRLEELGAAGVRAFKCFLSPSGVDEFQHVMEADLRAAFPVLARLGLPLMVHAEDPGCLLEATRPSARYADYLATRPVRAEHAAIEMLVRLMEWCPTPVHIVHLSSATSLPIIASARARGLPLTVETCPHYLTFASGEIGDGATEYKCAPPIREAAEREALWDALRDGDIDLVASDHSPCPPSMKGNDGDFHSAWGGIASLQLSLAAVWTGARKRGLEVERVAEWMSAAPAKLAGLDMHKGSLAPGHDADIVVWDPEASFTVRPERLLHRHPVTPYAGRSLHGVVEATFVGGKCVYDRSAAAG